MILKQKQHSMTKKLIVIGGPTAIGKTALTIELAKTFGSEIISADSRQVFKEMTIGTAVPDAEQLLAVKHHLIQHKSIHDNYNAAAYEHDAISTINELFKNQDIAFLTGGSGMYIEAVCSGIDDMPDIAPEIRYKTTQLLKTEGIEALQAILKKHDPEYFHEIDIQNPARLVRGVEMLWQTGQPFSLFRRKKARQRNFDIIRIALDIDRDLLHNRINQRFETMLNNGLLKEVEQLAVFQHLVPLKTVGYQEFFDFSNGKHTFDEAVELVKRNTRRYARKQLSWFRRNKNTQWFHPEQFDEIKKHIEMHLIHK